MKIWYKKNKINFNPAPTPLRRGGAGFTMIELVIALGVFSVGIMTSFTVALAGWRTSQENYDRILASNLAREGVEIVRNVRDSNWLKIDGNEDCDTGTPGTLDYCNWDDGLTALFVRAEYQNGLSGPLAYGDLDTGIDTCVSDVTCALYTDNTTGLFDHDAGGTISRLYRLIGMESICYDEATNTETIEQNTDCIISADPKVGIKVTSRIRWNRYNKWHTLDVVEYIYNWR